MKRHSPSTPSAGAHTPAPAAAHADHGSLVLQQLLDRAHEGVIVLDRDLRVQVWNSWLERVSGRSSAEMLDRDLAAAWPVVREQGIEPLLRRALTGESFPQVGLDLPTDPHAAAGGATRHSCGSIGPLHGLDGACAGVLWLVREVPQTTARDRDGEARMTQAVEAAGMAYWELELQTMVLTASPRFAVLLGLCADEPLTVAKIDAIQHPDDRQLGVHALRLAMSDPSGQFNNQYRVLPPDGRTRWIRSSGRVVRDARGNPARLYGVSQCITREVTDHAEHEANRHRLRSIMRASRVATWELHLESQTLTHSPELFDLFGLARRPTPLTIPELQRLKHPDDLVRSEAVAGAAVASPDGLYANHYRIITPKGEIAHMRSSGRVLSDHLGKPVSIVGAIYDVTELIIAQAAAAEAQEVARTQRLLMRLASQSAKVAPVDIDLKTHEIAHCPALMELLGLPADSRGLTCDSWRACIHPDDAEAAIARRDAHLNSTDREYHNAYRVVRPDGGVVWARMTMAIVRDADGTAVRLIGVVSDVSDLHEARHQAESSAAQLALAQKAINVGSWSMDLAAQMFHYDEPFALAMGFGESPGAMPLADLIARFHADDREETVQLVKDAATGICPLLQVDHRVRNSSGEYRCLRCTALPERDESGAIVRLRGISVDTTEQRRTARAILAAESRLAIAAEVANIASWEWDLDTGTLHFDEEKARLYGIDPSLRELPAADFGPLIHPDDRARVDTLVTGMLARGSDLNGLDYRIARADGTVRWVNSHGRFIPGPPGSKGRIIGLTMDITERANAGAKLQAAAQHMSMAAEVAMIGEWTLDLATGMMHCSPAWNRLFGLPPVETMRHVDEVHSRFDPDGARACDVALQAAVSGDGVFRTPDYRATREDGASRWMRCVGRVVGDRTRLVGITIDVTDSHLARETLERSNDELERLVRERTSELVQSHERLRSSERLATVGTLALGLGHDLGNILLPMRCELDVLRAGLKSDDLRKRADALRGWLDYLARLSASLHMLAAAPTDEAGPTTPHNPANPAAPAGDGSRSDTPMTIGEWWDTAEPLLRGTLPKNVVFEAKIAPGLPRVRAGVSGLSQSVLNLLLNAAEAVRNVPNPRVELIAELDSSGAARLAVRDNGAGMSDQTRARATEPFFTTKPRGLSTGLGLSLVESIVRGAGGNVTIASQPGRGTTVTLTLPVADATQPTPSAT